MLILKLTLPQWASLDQPQNPEENPPHWGEKTGEKIHKHKSFCKKPLNIDINIDIKPITTSRSKAKHQNFGVSPGDLTGLTMYERPFTAKELCTTQVHTSLGLGSVGQISSWSSPAVAQLELKKANWKRPNSVLYFWKQNLLFDDFSICQLNSMNGYIKRRNMNP